MTTPNRGRTSGSIRKAGKSFDRSIEKDVIKCNRLLVEDEINGPGAYTASNVLGGDAGVFNQQTGMDFEFKTLVAGANVTINDNTPLAGQIEIVSALAPTPPLATVLGVGNTTGGTNISVNTGDAIDGSSGTFNPGGVGEIFILGDNGPLAIDNGRDVRFTAGNGGALALGGYVVLDGGQGGATSGNGGNIVITGGDATSGNGGHVAISPGITAGGGTDGLVQLLNPGAAAATRIMGFYELGNTNYVGFRAPNAIAGNVNWILPNADATVAGQALTSNAAGTLSWATVGGGFTTNNTLYVDANYGNDGTATADDPALPWQTFSAALAAAAASDLIIVRPGTYTGSFIVSQTQFIHFEPGAVLSNTGATTILTLSGASTIYISGRLRIDGTGGPGSTNGLSIQTTLVSNIEFDRIQARSDAVTCTSACIGQVILRGNGINSTQNDGSAFTVSDPTADLSVYADVQQFSCGSGGSANAISLSGSGVGVVSAFIKSQQITSNGGPAVLVNDMVQLYMDAQRVGITSGNDNMFEFTDGGGAPFDMEVFLNIGRITTVGNGDFVVNVENMDLTANIGYMQGQVQFNDLDSGSVNMNIGMMDDASANRAAIVKTVSGDDVKATFKVTEMVGGIDWRGGTVHFDIDYMNCGSVGGTNVLNINNNSSTNSACAWSATINRLSVGAGNFGIINFPGGTSFQGSAVVKINQVIDGTLDIDSQTSFNGTNTSVLLDITCNSYRNIDINDMDGNFMFIMRQQSRAAAITVSTDIDIVTDNQATFYWEVFGDLLLDNTVNIENVDDSHFSWIVHGILRLNMSTFGDFAQSAGNVNNRPYAVLRWDRLEQTSASGNTWIVRCNRGQIELDIGRIETSSTTQVLRFQTGRAATLNDEEGINCKIESFYLDSTMTEEPFSANLNSGHLRWSIGYGRMNVNFPVLMVDTTGASPSTGTGRLIVHDTYVEQVAGTISDTSTLVRIDVDPIQSVLLKDCTFIVDLANATAATHDGFITVDGTETLDNALWHNCVTNVDNLTGGAGTITTQVGNALPDAVTPGLCLFGSANYGNFDNGL